MICPEDKLDTAINANCPDISGMENNGYLTLRSGLRNKSVTDYMVTFTVSEPVIPVYQPMIDLSYKPKSDGTVNAYGLAKFDKGIEVFIIENTELSQKQIMQLKDENNSWVFVGKQKDGQNIVYGYERGLRVKTSAQDFGSTETHGGILLTLSEMYANTSMLFCSDAIYDIKDYEVITGLTIALNGAIEVSVDTDKSCKVILSDGTTLTSTAGVITAETASIGGDVVILVSKDTALLSLDGSEFTGNMNFVVSDKNEILIVDCDFTTGECDYILNILIANGTVTGTHTIDFTDNLQAPASEKITIVEGLGWTVPFLDLIEYDYNEYDNTEYY